MTNKIYKIATFITVALLLLLGLLLIVTAFPVTGNIKAYVVQSGSMEPAIKTGSLVFIKPHASYKIGDVITFGPEKLVPTTHRIVEIKDTYEGRVYTTKGDANQSSDENSIQASEIRGSVFLNIPYFGYIVHFARQPLGFGVLIVLPALILIFDEIKKILGELRKMRKSEAEVVEKETEN